MHIINHLLLVLTSLNNLSTYPVSGIKPIKEVSASVPYSSIPHAKAAKHTDSRLDGV